MALMARKCLKKEKMITSPSEEDLQGIEKPAMLYRTDRLVRSEGMEDFVDYELQKRRHMMPYWILGDNGMLVFHYVNERTDRKEIEQDIKEKRVYIRTCDAQNPGTIKNIDEKPQSHYVAE